MEAADCGAIADLQQEHIDRGPKVIHSLLLLDFLNVCLLRVLTEAEQHLVRTLPPKTERIPCTNAGTPSNAVSRLKLEAVIEGVTNLDRICSDHDIRTISCEQIIEVSLRNRRSS